MAKEGANVPVAIKPKPCLVIKKEQGYEFKMVDCGNAGVQLHVYRKDAPYWDADAGIMLELKDLNRLGHWIAKTTGRPAMVLPFEMRKVLRAVIRKNRNRKSKFLATNERLVLKRALRALNAILNPRTPSGKQISLAARALSRK